MIHSEFDLWGALVALLPRLIPYFMSFLTRAPSSACRICAPTAYDVKEVHRLLRDFSDDELKQIPVMPEGSRLQQGAKYIDLADPARREFTAVGDVHVRPGAYYVPKHEVDYVLWNRLIGVTNPERLDQGNVPLRSPLLMVAISNPDATM